MEEVTDPRDKELITYDLKTILWVALIMMVTKRGARYKVTHQMRSPEFLKNLKELCNQENLKEAPHGDTLEYSMMRLKEDELENIISKMIKQLLRNRVLEPYRLLGKYHTIAIDGVHTHTFYYKHCDRCLYRSDDNGNKWWMHYKLQASLVTPSGLCLPVAAEWIQNDKRPYDKQDCEIKACKRLLKKLRSIYTQLPICVILDGLYACAPMFSELKKHDMEWIVVFKEGSMSESYKWVMDMKNSFSKDNVLHFHDHKEIEARYARTHADRITREKPRHEKRIVSKKTTYTWKANIEHWDGKRIFNVMTCKEVEDGVTNCDYVWLVSAGLKLGEHNVKELAERGRCRWVIENQGNNILKNGGYHLEHLYSRDPVSMKTWNCIMDMAFLINQLIEKGSLIAKEAYGSIVHIAARMFEHFRYLSFKRPAQRPKIQIRLRWDTS